MPLKCGDQCLGLVVLSKMGMLVCESFFVVFVLLVPSLNAASLVLFVWFIVDGVWDAKSLILCTELFYFCL